MFEHESSTSVQFTCIFIIFSSLIFYRARVSPFEVPYFGVALHLAGKDIIQVFHRWSLRFGSRIRFTLFGHPHLLLSDPADIRQILASKKCNIRFTNSDAAAKLTGTFDQGILVNNNIKIWSFHRQNFVRAIGSTKMLRTMTILSSKNADKLLHNIFLPDGLESNCVNVVNAFCLFSLDTVGQLALGIDFGGLTTTKCFEKEGLGPTVLKHVSTYIESKAFFLVVPQWLWSFPFIRDKVQLYVENANELRDIEMQIVQDTRRKMQESKSQNHDDTTTKHNFLTALLELQEEEQQHGKDEASMLSDNAIRQDVREVLLAGSDTSAHSLSFIYYFLAKYPHYADRIREEIDEIMPKSVEADPTEFYTSLRKLVFLNAFITEVFRLMKAAPMHIRGCREEEVLRDGFIIPKGTNIFLNQYSACRDPAFISNPEEFQPERFLGNEAQQNQKLFYPFGFGTRQCPGQHFASTEMLTAIVRILPHVNLELVHPDKVMKFNFKIVYHFVNNDLQVKFSRR